MPTVAGTGTTLRQRLVIYGYIGFLYLVLPFTGVWGITARFVMKDDLHMSAHEISKFLLLVNIPGYLGFVFGFVRDRWGPFGRRDQGLLLLFGGMATALLLGAAGLNPTYAVLFVVAVGGSIVGQFLSSAMQGLTSVLGQEHVMSGRITAVWQVAAGIPALAVSVVGGHLADLHSPHLVFLISGGVALAFTLFTAWRPPEVYGLAEAAPIVKRNVFGEALRLMRTPALYPIVLLLFLWNFTPGMGTPMQFYLTDNLHGKPSDYGNFNALFNACFIPGYLLYGFLCPRISYPVLLWVCTFLAVPQIVPLLFVHDARSALIAAVPMGLMGGPATAAYFDLLIRACPKGLQGTAMMLGASAWLLSAELGNIAGSDLYDIFHSFYPCAWATVVVYAMLIPVLCFVPESLTSTRDGETIRREEGPQAV